MSLPSACPDDGDAGIALAPTTSPGLPAPALTASSAAVTFPEVLPEALPEDLPAAPLAGLGPRTRGSRGLDGRCAEPEDVLGHGRRPAPGPARRRTGERPQGRRYWPRTVAPARRCRPRRGNRRRAPVQLRPVGQLGPAGPLPPTGFPGAGRRKPLRGLPRRRQPVAHAADGLQPARLHGVLAEFPPQVADMYLDGAFVGFADV